MFVPGALEPAAALHQRAMATALWPNLLLQPRGNKESEIQNGKTTKKKGRETSQQPTTEEETGSRGATPAAPSPWDLNTTNLCERVMHPARVNVSSVAKQCLGNISRRSRQGIRIFFSCVCLMASMARSVNCLGQKKAVQVHLIGAKPIVQVKK